MNPTSICDDAAPLISRSSPLYINAIGIAASGLPNWAAACSILDGTRSYNPEELAPYLPELLPRNERRRAPPAVRQAFRAAEEAISVCGTPASKLATVFATSDADTSIIHRIALALSETDRVVSPTDFHNSVANAASGYWSIAVGCQRPSSTLCAYDASFAAGVLDAASMALTESDPILLVAYDVPPPEPLWELRPIGTPASVALVLARSPGPLPLGTVKLSTSDRAETRMPAPELESLRLANPAMRALPLLQHLALKRSGTIVLPGNEDNNLLVVFETP